MDKAVYTSCYGLLFFGVPNRGMETETIQTIVKDQPNADLIRALNPGSRFLSELRRQFDECFTWKDSEIISWYETCTTTLLQVCPV